MLSLINIQQMSYSGPMSRNRLLGMKNYLGKPSFATSIGWKRENKANILVEKELQQPPNAAPQQDAYCIVVGEVSDHKLYTSPVGNYNPTYNVLHEAKFQLTLDRPTDPDFGPDWATAINNLEACQEIVAIGNDRRYLILKDGGNFLSIRFSAPLVETRASPIPPDGTLDDDTAKWPVPVTHREAFDQIKHAYQVLPLMVYDMAGKYVLPEEVSSKIRGALVEVHFRVKHYFINNPTEKFNTFTGIMEQITILRPALPRIPSPYRSRNKTGPYRPPPTPTRGELKRAADTFLPAPPMSSSDIISKLMTVPTGVPVASSSVSTTVSSASTVQLGTPIPTIANTSAAGITSSPSPSSTLSDAPSEAVEDEDMVDVEDTAGKTRVVEEGSPAKKRKLRK
ncbi:hypothetical protein Hypma_000843 [Hypsizygus marmoreus]|uniref:Uncharacterized protein n=1 Tax=Hypsizygus marmoreus TaxID=39966 RepID=A0A369JB66_HYPMA|nr:hypothetical protein Hypma_000843 [Hypsizygus marmoreus]